MPTRSTATTTRSSGGRPALLGERDGLELQRDGRSGVVSNAMFDYYWPGYEDSTPLGHNTVCLLTEVAGVKVASPIVVNADGSARVLPGACRNTARRSTFPIRGRAARWTLRDIVDYNLSAVDGLLYGVAAYREPHRPELLRHGPPGGGGGRRGGPFAYIIPPEQHDPYAVARLEELLLRGAVEIYRAIEPFRADGEPYQVGTDIILMSQPYRAYVKTLLERQVYPKRAPVAAGPPGPTTTRPYDVGRMDAARADGRDGDDDRAILRAALDAAAHGGCRPCRPRCGVSAGPASTSSTPAALPARSPPTG